MTTPPDNEILRSAWPRRVTWTYFGAYALWAIAMFVGGVPRGTANDLVFLPLYIAAGFAAWRASQSQLYLPRNSLGWRFVAAAWFVSGAGAALIAAARSWPYPLLSSVASGVYQLYFLLLLIGLWQFMEFPTGTSARLRLTVEILIVAVTTVVLAWYWIFRFDEATQSPANYLKALIVMFPGELVVSICAVAIVHRPVHDGPRRAYSYLSVGTLIASVADFVYGYDSLFGPGSGGVAGDLLLALAAAMVVSAADVSTRGGKSEQHPAIAIGPALVPYLAIALVSALALYQRWRPDLQHPALSGLVLGGATLLGLMILRLVVAQREFAVEADARAAQDSRFRAMVQRSSDAILLVGRDGEIRYASPPFGAMIGDSERDYAGCQLADLIRFDPPGELENWLAHPVAHPLARWKVGENRDIEALATCHVTDPAIGGVVINARDVSERTRLEARLQQAQKLEAVGRFAASVAHDFNNVLTVMSANLHFLSRDSTGERAEEFVQMEAAVGRGAALARQLSSLSRPRTSKATTTDLAAAVRAAQQTLRILLPSSIETEVVAPGTPLIVPLDDVQAEQILLNLALNSRDAMPEGGRLVIRLDAPAMHDEMPAQHGRTWASLTVSDTGMGMSTEVASRALEPFFTTKEDFRGSGLGLSSVQSIVSTVGGRVALESTPDVGTTVTIWFPVVQKLVAESVRLPAKTVPRGNGRLVVVDDEPAIRHLVSRYLVAAGCEAVELQDGQAALEYLEQHSSTVQVVLTDLVMPHMSGQDLASRIADRWPHIAVMFMSGTPNVLEGRREAWASSPVFAKPLDLPEVARRVAATLKSAVPLLMVAGLLLGCQPNLRTSSKNPRTLRVSVAGR